MLEKFIIIGAKDKTTEKRLSCALKVDRLVAARRNEFKENFGNLKMFAIENLFFESFPIEL